MSLYDDASLIITPNAYKTSKLYSIKPTDGSGDLSVVRATTATRVNSDGLIESVGANIPRLDYSNGCPSILVEPQRTNLITNSLGYSSGSNYTITTNNLSLDGSNNAILATEKTTPGTYIINSVSATILPSTTYTYSFFVKSNGITTLPINASDGVVGNISSVNIITGQVISGSAIVTNYNNGWFRISVTRTTSVSASSGFMQFNFGAKTGDGVSGFYLYGFQIEAGSNATSYIPTVASTVTRNADVISKTGISDLIGQTEGTIVAKFSTKELNTFKRILSIKSSNNQNRIALRIINSNNLGTEVVANNLVVYNANANVGFTSNTFFKIAVKYTNTNIKLFVNGVLILNSGIVSLNFSTLLDTIVVGVSESSLISENINGEIKQAQIYKTALTDAECIALTTL